MKRISASRLFLFAALGLFLSQPLLAQVPAIRSAAASAAVRIDGRTDDWSVSELVRDAKSGAEFAFQNDGRNIYVLLVVRDPKALESIDSSGLTVLARTAGGARSGRGVLFLRQMVPAETYFRWHESQGALMTEAEKAKLKDAVRHDLCLAFAVGEKGSIHGPLRRLPTSEPPEFGVSEQAGGEVYELKIPLPPPDLVPGGVGARPGESVRLSFTWGGASRKIGGTKAIRETPPSEAGGLSGVATPAQEFLNMFDALSRPSVSTKKFAFAVDVRLAEAK